ncbi:MAG TPA: glycosyltransferase family 9 protein [Ktedonobacterales bacterium]
MGRYVLIRPGALGDALLALPTLALLRRERPEAHMTLVARGDVLPLARASALAGATYDWSDPMWATLFADAPRADEAQAAVRDAAVVAWLADEGGTVARNLAAWGARQVVVAPSRPPEDRTTPREHMALLLARALAPLGIAVPAAAESLAAAMPPLRVDPHDTQTAARVWDALDLGAESRPVVALHPGSGGAAKRWAPERFGELARRLTASGCRPLLVEGPADAEVTAAVLAALDTEAGVMMLARRLSIGALAALLRRCAAYVGNDSGVSHLAALAGVPTLALFGPSDPTLWAPLGPRVRILRAPAGDLALLEAGAVCEALDSMLLSLRPMP